MDRGFDADELEKLATGKRNGAAGSRPTVILRSGAELTPEPVRWLWPGWLAAGKLHIVAGAPGAGKTTLALALAATLTVGGRWPDGTAAPVGNVAIWSGEDAPVDTLLPPLLAAGANPDRFHFVEAVTDVEGQRPFAPAADLPLLSDALAQTDTPPALMIVDPVVSAVAGDSHKNAEVRRALQPLVDLAQRHRCAVLGISHFSKGTTGRDPVERVTGSLGFGALARVVMVTAKRSDEDGGGRLLAKAKSNLGPDMGGYVYELEPCEPRPGIETTRLLWREVLDGTARELLASAEAVTDDEERTAMDEARDFLLAELAAGPMPSKDVLRDASQLDIAGRTLRRAKKALGIIAEKAAFSGGWRWRLPDRGDQDPEDDSKVLKPEPWPSSATLATFGDSSPPDPAQDGHARPRRPTAGDGHLGATLDPADEADINASLDRIGETDPEARTDKLRQAATDLQARAGILALARDMR